MTVGDGTKQKKTKKSEREAEMSCINTQGRSRWSCISYKCLWSTSLFRMIHQPNKIKCLQWPESGFGPWSTNLGCKVPRESTRFQLEKVYFTYGKEKKMWDSQGNQWTDLPAGMSWCRGSCLAPWEVAKLSRGYCSTHRTLRISPSAKQ